MARGRDPEGVCRAHGLRYDPGAAAGCERCGTGDDRDRREAAGLGKRAAAALAVAVIATFFLRTSDEPEPGPRDGPGPPVMEPHPYRPMIEQLESVLYADRAAAPADAEHLRHWAARLARHMEERTPHRTRVRRFASWVEARAGPGFGDADLRAARRRWEALRADVFEPADWFGKSR